MRIGLYGMPTCGKSYILDKINFMEVIHGSQLLRQMTPDFDSLDDAGRNEARRKFALMVSQGDNYIVDGHYAFGDELAFTVEDGEMYDAFVYIYIDPDILMERMGESDKNRKYLRYGIAKWQFSEIEGLREYCHKNDKDFYVIDNPPHNSFADTDMTLDFLQDINYGYSCLNFAKQCASSIIERTVETRVDLLDGDKTITIADTSSAVFGYRTHLYDGNFYTGFQAWKQGIEFRSYEIPKIREIPISLNDKVLSICSSNSFILTSGHENIWRFIASELGYGYFCGDMMSAETKYFITKFLQASGKFVTAFGDGMNDYYMLKQADVGYLVTRPDGSISRSLRGRSVEGLNIVYTE